MSYNKNTPQASAEQNTKKKRGVSGLVISLVLIAIAVVGGGIIAAIVLTSGSDTQDSAEEATNIGGIATYDANCRFSGTPIAVLHAFDDGSETTLASEARGQSELSAPNVHTTGLVAQIRTVSGAAFLSEQAHGGDFTGDGIRDDRIPTDDIHVAFYGSATTPAPTNIANASNIGLDLGDWSNLGLDTGSDAGDNDNEVQIFVNRARDCWGIRRV